MIFFLYNDFKEGGFESFFSGNAKFAILPSFCSEEIPSSVVDVFINTDSMMEMNPSVIGQYFKSIHKATSIGGLFYCVNRRHKADVGVPVRIKDYPFDDRWYLSCSRPLPDSPNTQELVAIRTGHANAYPISRALADLGPFTVSEVMGQWRQALRRTAAFVVGTGVGSGNPGLVNIILGLSEEPRNPIRKLRKRLAMIRSRLGKAWLRRGGGGKWDIS
ncbi:hypothetical protein [Magnetospirillum aberrantis]|uniref:Uncharacterized protein n=1 Tax=Magnetospirillum aberrantis SpK TaxID=908842 RepID=A0A7C9USB7_9PROT|nr:hypothetical protein [Magnetospirillum aberrantis]NFV79187.1 hypothetical protein [Magnetospirillum aberrantis SpK]